MEQGYELYKVKQKALKVQELLDKIDDLDLATQAKPGLMSSEDKMKLDGIDPTDLATEEELAGKQDVIEDLEAIRSGAEKGSTAYQKPVNGIPSSDLDQETQTALGKAGTALQTETDPTVPGWAKQPTKPSYTAQEVGAMPAGTHIPDDPEQSDWDEADNSKLSFIKNKPTNVSTFNNDAGYLTAQDITGKEDKPTVNASSASSLTLANNNEYRYTSALASLALSLPGTIDSDFCAWLVFVSGSTATSLTYPNTIKWSGDDVDNNVFLPVASKTYNVGFWYDGINVNAVVRGV